MGYRRRLTLTGSPISALLARWTQPGIVKNIQAGTIDLNGVTSNTATITSVDVSNALIFHSGFTSAGGGGSNTQSTIYTRVALTNATTVTATVGAGIAAATPVAYVVIEFYPGVLKYVQRGTIALNAGTSQTASITSPVNTLKAFAIYLGANSNNATDAWVASYQQKVVLTNGTTVTATVAQGSANSTVNTVGYQVAEFF